VKARLFIALLFISLSAVGQQLPDLSNYQHNWIIYNPAYTGSREVLSTSLFVRQKSLSGPGPKYQQLSAHTPLKNNKVALGLSYFREQNAGTISLSDFFDAPFTKETMMMSYTYRIWAGSARLALGLTAGVSIYGESFRELSLTDPGDSYFVAGEREFLPNVGAGLLYYTDDYFLGLSVPYFLSRGITRNSIAHDFNKYTAVFTGGYNLKASDIFSFKPTGLLMYDVGMRTMNYQGSLNFGFLNERFWIGAIYKSSKAIAFNANISLNDQWLLGYSYDYYLDNMNGYFHGSHEIVLRWEWIKTVKTSVPFYF